jgi:hypothetical protein
MEDFLQIFLIGLIILFILFVYSSKYSLLVAVKSDIDKETYIVRKQSDSQDAANLLCKLKLKLVQVINILNEKHPNDKRVTLLISRFNPKNISESIPGTNYTSYSINKGEKIVFCIRNKITDKFVNINTLLFVGIHELAHLMSTSIGHTEEFWDNMRFILKNSIQSKIYKKQDFEKNPKKYCGTIITSSPLK